MRRKTRKQKNDELRRRYDAIKSMMSTLTMATVTFVAAIVLIPASAKAEIIKVNSSINQITYQVSVTDVEESLDPSTLFVVLENQLEYYEHSVSLGEQNGYFNDLTENTEYNLSVYGNKGFGQERLATTSIKTKEKEGGLILSVSPQQEEHMTSYNVQYAINDPNNVYDSFVLEYIYNSPHEGEEPIKIVKPVLKTETEISLQDIYTDEAFDITLKGLKGTKETILDQIKITPPFIIHASLYQKHITKNTIEFFFYKDYYLDDVTYIINVYQNKEQIQTINIDTTDEEDEHKIITLRDLIQDTEYTVECIAYFFNPQTLTNQEQVVYIENIKTLGFYEITYEYFSDFEYVEVIITVTDPSNYFDQVYYQINDTSSGEELYVFGESILLDIDGEIKTKTLSIFTEHLEQYTIEIELQSQTNYQIYEEVIIIKKD